MGLHGNYKYFNSFTCFSTGTVFIFSHHQPFQRGDCLYTSESDVFIRQILTYKDSPRAERVDGAKIKAVK